jgi:hypothetical protein
MSNIGSGMGGPTGGIRRACGIKGTKSFHGPRKNEGRKKILVTSLSLAMMIIRLELPIRRCVKVDFYWDVVRCGFFYSFL